MAPSDSVQSLSFPVLQLLSKERGVYGLRNGDYERYRRHCANKLHRLRQVTGLTNGKGKVYKKSPALTDDSVKDVKHLQLLLFTAERAMTHSHEFKAISTKPDAPRSTRRDQISWLRRALKASTALHTISSSLTSSTPARLSQKTLAEITIYHLSIRAELSFEHSNWAETLTDLAARRKLLSTISEAARDSYDQALAIEYIDQYDPLIRFSAYKLGRSESHDIEGVVKDIDDEMMEEGVPGFSKLVEGLRSETGAAEMEQGRKTLNDIEFAGDKVEMRNAEIVEVMLRVQESLGRLKGKAESGSGRGMKGWDKVLGVLGEAEGVARRLLDDHEASGSNSSLRSTETSKSLSLVHQYIVYLLLSHRIRRDLLLVETMASSSTALPTDPATFKIPGGRIKTEEAVKSLAAIVKLYDTVLQSMGQLRSLAVVEEKEGVRLANEGLEAYFHATRCYHLARLHCVHPSPTYSSAVQLLGRCHQLVSQARTSLFDPAFPLQEEIISLPETSVADLESRIKALDLAAKQALFAERIPKPVFFDNAFNYIDLPMDELLVKAGKKSAESVSTSKPTSAAAETVAETVVHQVEKAAEEVKKTVAGRERSKESTPAPEAQDDKPKGWLGGWFGRG